MILILPIFIIGYPLFIIWFFYTKIYITIFTYILNINILNFIETSKFWFPFIQSLVSALIFWIVFSYYPERKRKKQLRPIIELDIYSINNELFALFDLLFRINLHSASLFQEDIHSGKLKKEDFQIALQNKCLNDTYKFEQAYFSIGENILSRYKNIEKLIDKIANLNQYADTEELLLLEQIRTNIKMYNLNEKSINEKAVSVINSQQNLGYMHQQMFELYNLYKNLQRLIFIKSKYENRNILLHKIQYLFYSDQYTECKKVIKNGKNKYESTINLLEYYDLLCDYNLSKLDYKKVEYILNKKYYNGSLVSIRSFLIELINDKEFYSLLKKLYSQEEIEHLNKILTDERNQKEAFIKINESILNFFKNKYK